MVERRRSLRRAEGSVAGGFRIAATSAYVGCNSSERVRCPRGRRWNSAAKRGLPLRIAGRIGDGDGAGDGANTTLPVQVHSVAVIVVLTAWFPVDLVTLWALWYSAPSNFRLSPLSWIHQRHHEPSSMVALSIIVSVLSGEVGHERRIPGQAACACPCLSTYWANSKGSCPEPARAEMDERTSRQWPVIRASGGFPWAHPGAHMWGLPPPQEIKTVFSPGDDNLTDH
ncbi:hypothetical protein FH972_024550 [Carpinus fangiana]|uniref:Uncharacterized protein n=1 Tax=Carpinus fangiana TaxID=176857 RepID=A0A5N6KYS8_9ROSI|nr:hypothetical protein FH972_024550 [Carpinus fangiana]